MTNDSYGNDDYDENDADINNANNYINTTTITTAITDDNDIDNNNGDVSVGLSVVLLLNPKYTRTRQ